MTGSNSVNVFLGLGLPWTIASVYYRVSKSESYYVPSGSLAFSVILFLVTSSVCIIVLLVRRKIVGGELGGGKVGRISSAIFLCILWVIYVVFSALEVYDIIDGVTVGDAGPVPRYLGGPGK